MNAMKELAAKAAAEAAALKEKAAQAANDFKANELGSKLKETAAAAARAAEKKAATSGLSKNLEAARSSFSNLSSLMRQGDEAAHGVGDSSDDGAHTEDERLVKEEGEQVKDRVFAGLSAFGSKLAATLDGARDGARVASANVANASASVGQLARDASAKSMDGARAARTGVVAAGASVASAGASAANRSADGLRSAKGRCGDALNAAAAVSGISVPGQPRERQCCGLSYRQRLIGCACCMALGTLLSLFSLGSFASLLLGNPAPFAFKYSLGNLLSLGAASFLVGPRAQLRGMLAPSRRWASITYLLTLLGTLLSVFVLRRALVSLLLIVLQAAALSWYMLSYVPYGHALAKRLLRKLLRRAGLSGGLLLGAEPSAHAAGAVSPAGEG